MKVLIKSILKTKENVINTNVKGIKVDNTVTYFEDDIKTSIIINENEIKIIRDSKEQLIDLTFKNKGSSGRVMINDNLGVDLDIKTSIMIVEENYIYIKYELNNEVYEYTLRFEEIV